VHFACYFNIVVAVNLDSAMTKKGDAYNVQQQGGGGGDSQGGHSHPGSPGSLPTELSALLPVAPVGLPQSAIHVDLSLSPEQRHHQHHHQQSDQPLQHRRQRQFIDDDGQHR
jgi:hypothetical protein